MEQALRSLLSGVIGEKLLDPEGLELLKEVRNLKEKHFQVKESFQKTSNEQIQLSKDVSMMREMLAILHDLTRTLENEIEKESRIENDMSWQIQNHERSALRGEEQLSSIENTIENLHHKILTRERDVNRMERNVTADSELLEDLLYHMGTNDENNLLILKITFEDKAEIKKLNIGLEELSDKVAKAECEYRQTINELNAWKTTRGHLLSSFLGESRRRDELLLMWEQTLNELGAKNNQHMSTFEETNVVQAKIDSLRLIRDDEDYLLKQIQSSLKEIQAVLEDVDKDTEFISFKTLGVLEAFQETSSQVNELLTCKSKLETDLLQTKKQIQNILILLQEKKSFLKKVETKNSKLEAELLLEADLLLSSEQSLRTLETIREDCERQNSVLEGQIKYIQRLKQKHNQEGARVLEETKTTEGLIGALKATISKTSKDISSFKQNILKYEKLIYHQEYEIEEVKSRLYKLTHDDDNNICDDGLKNVVKNLKENLSNTKQNILLLKRTLPLLKTKKGKTLKELQTKEKTCSELDQKALDFKLECKVIEKEKCKILYEREESEVDDTFSELFLKNRLEKLSEIQDEIQEIRKTRLEMEQCFQEEKKGLEGSISATKIQIRELEGRLSNVLRSAHAINRAVDQIKEKMNRIRKCINVSKDEIEVSPIDVMLKVAREREGLQEAGDLLDAEVRKAEIEVESLQKILTLLSIESDEFRGKFRHLAYHHEEGEEKLNLEDKLHSIERNIEICNHLYTQDRENLQKEKDYLRENELQLRAITELLQEKTIHIKAIDRDIGNQLIKIKQANLACKALKQKLTTKTLHLSDIELRVLQERIKFITNIIGEESVTDAEVFEACVLYCQQENVPPPPKGKRSTLRRDFGSRSSLGSITSFKGKETIERKDSMISSNAKQQKRYSSLSSLHSQDSGSSSVASSSIELGGLKTLNESEKKSVMRIRPKSDSSSKISFKNLNEVTKTRERKIGKEEKEKGLKVIVPGIPPLKPEQRQFRGKKIIQKPSDHQ